MSVDCGLPAADRGSGTRPPREAPRWRARQRSFAFGLFTFALMIGTPTISRADGGEAAGPAKGAARPKPGALVVHAGSELPGLLAALAHGRPLVLHFCATWCPACAGELDSLRGTLAGLDKRGVSLALIWIDDAATRAKIPAFAARHRVGKLPAIALDAPDPAPVAKALGEPQWDGALPATFVYDVHQAKVQSFLGDADAGLLGAAIEAAIARK